MSHPGGAKVYIAARYDRREEMAAYGRELEPLGYVINADWLLGAHEALDGTDDVELCGQWATQDAQDIFASDLFLTFTEPRGKGGRGGRHVELGMAYALNRQILVVGPAENVFHCLPSIKRFATWEEAKAFLAEKAR